MAAVCSLMGGATLGDLESIRSMFTHRQLEAMSMLPDEQGVRRPPSDTTFGRMLAACDVHELVAVIGRWLEKQAPSTEVGCYATSLTGG